jgi:hypothetical protein
MYDTGESTKVLFTSQISAIAARKYPIAILYEKITSKNVEIAVNRNKRIEMCEKKM